MSREINQLSEIEQMSVIDQPLCMNVKNSQKRMTPPQKPLPQIPSEVRLIKQTTIQNNDTVVHPTKPKPEEKAPQSNDNIQTNTRYTYDEFTQKIAKLEQSATKAVYNTQKIQEATIKLLKLANATITDNPYITPRDNIALALSNIVKKVIQDGNKNALIAILDEAYSDESFFELRNAVEEFALNECKRQAIHNVDKNDNVAKNAIEMMVIIRNKTYTTQNHNIIDETILTLINIAKINTSSAENVDTNKLKNILEVLQYAQEAFASLQQQDDCPLSERTQQDLSNTIKELKTKTDIAKSIGDTHIPQQTEEKVPVNVQSRQQPIEENQLKEKIKTEIQQPNGNIDANKTESNEDEKIDNQENVEDNLQTDQQSNENKPIENGGKPVQAEQQPTKENQLKEKTETKEPIQTNKNVDADHTEQKEKETIKKKQKTDSAFDTESISNTSFSDIDTDAISNPKQTEQKQSVLLKIGSFFKTFFKPLTFCATFVWEGIVKISMSICNLLAHSSKNDENEHNIANDFIYYTQLNKEEEEMRKILEGGKETTNDGGMDLHERAITYERTEIPLK